MDEVIDAMEAHFVDRVSRATEPLAAELRALSTKIDAQKDSLSTKIDAQKDALGADIRAFTTIKSQDDRSRELRSTVLRWSATTVIGSPTFGAGYVLRLLGH